MLKWLKRIKSMVQNVYHNSYLTAEKHLHFPDNVKILKCINIYAYIYIHTHTHTHTTIYCGSKKVTSVTVHILCPLWLFMSPWMNEHCGYIIMGSEWSPSVFNTHLLQLNVIQGVPGGMDKTSGECSLCRTIPI